MYVSARYTGKNANDVIKLLDDCNNNELYANRYFYMEKSMNHDANDPVLIINKVYKDDFDNSQLLIMYPGDYIMFICKYYDEKIHITNRIIPTKNFFRVAKRMCEDQPLTIKREEP